MSRGKRLIGVVVSVSLLGGVGIAAPSTAGAKPKKPTKCKKGFRYDKKRKKCVKKGKHKPSSPYANTSCGDATTLGTHPFTIKNITGRNVTCIDATVVAQRHYCRAPCDVAGAGTSTDRESHPYNCTRPGVVAGVTHVTCRSSGSRVVEWDYHFTATAAP
jgi:hypothetical protein